MATLSQSTSRVIWGENYWIDPALLKLSIGIYLLCKTICPNRWCKHFRKVGASRIFWIWLCHYLWAIAWQDYTSQDHFCSIINQASCLNLGTSSTHDDELVTCPERDKGSVLNHGWSLSKLCFDATDTSLAEWFSKGSLWVYVHIFIWCL